LGLFAPPRNTCPAPFSLSLVLINAIKNTTSIGVVEDLIHL